MITLDDQIREIEREIERRRRVYRDLVAGRRMFQSDADRQLAVLSAALATLRTLRVQHSTALERAHG